MPYVILSDSLQMKERLCELYPHFILSMDKPVLAIAMILNKSRTRFVIFFLFTTAREVYAFSIYDHGSGFSEWACKLYNVPYHAKHIQ